MHLQQGNVTIDPRWTESPWDLTAVCGPSNGHSAQHVQRICDQNRSRGGVKKDTSKHSFRGGQENVWGTATQRGNIAARMKSAGKVTVFPLLFQKQANQGPRDLMVYITLLGDLLPWPGLIPGRELRSCMLCHEAKKKKMLPTFFKLRVWANPASRKSLSAVCPTVFVHLVSLHHLLVIRVMF